MCDVHVAE